MGGLSALAARNPTAAGKLPLAPEAVFRQSLGLLLGEFNRRI